MRDPIEKLRGYTLCKNFDGMYTQYCPSDDLADEIEAAYMKLPVDANGVPIRPGDLMQFRTDAPVRVDSIGNSRCYEGDFGWFGGNGGFYGSGTLGSCRHVKPDTVESLLEEFGDWYKYVKGGSDEPGIVADYAERIRKAVEK